MDEIIQTIELAVSDAPSVPGTGGFFGGDSAAASTVNLIIALVFILIVTTIAILLRRRSTRRFILPIFACVLVIAGVTTAIANAATLIPHTDPIILSIVRPETTANATVDLSALYATYSSDPDSITVQNVTGDFSVATTLDSSAETLDVLVTLGDSIVAGNYTAEIVYSYPEPIVYMQDLTPAICSTLSPWDGSDGEILVLKDQRDEQEYNIAKLSDGNCWMLNNLKLGSTAGTMTLTPTDTNITSDWDLPQVTAGVLSYDVPYVFGPVPGDNSDIDSANFYGYLYNWCSATAGGTASGGSDTCTAAPIMPANATGDICPINWRLPQGGLSDAPGNEFANLIATASGYPSNTDTGFIGAFDNSPTFAANIQPAGAFRGNYAGGWGSGFTSQGTIGNWWSNSAYSSNPNRSFYLYVDTWGNVHPEYTANRHNGFAVRCLLN